MNEVRAASVVDDPGRFVVIAPDSFHAEVVFDGTASSDPDGDMLAFVWSERQGGSIVPFGLGVRTTNIFETDGLATYNLTLSVSDGVFSASQDFQLVVVSPAAVVLWLIDILKTDALPARARTSLLTSLRRAMASFEEGNDEHAVRALNEFLRKSRHQQISPIPARAEGVRALTRILINAVIAE